ncbi:MAG: DUF488 family protein [Roseiflexaceae bacterium]
MPNLYTIGFTQLPLAEFIGLLRGAGVDAVVDIRLRNTSQLAGWAKRDDLSFLLREGFSIAYEHVPLFAPTDELLDRYHADRDWDAYVPVYRALLAARPILELGRDLLDRYRAPCLLCSEPTPDRCHRRLLAEYLAEHLHGVVVTHLLGERATKQPTKNREQRTKNKVSTDD